MARIKKTDLENAVAKLNESINSELPSSTVMVELINQINSVVEKLEVKVAENAKADYQKMLEEIETKKKEAKLFAKKYKIKVTEE